MLNNIYKEIYSMGEDKICSPWVPYTTTVTATDYIYDTIITKTHDEITNIPAYELREVPKVAFRNGKIPQLNIKPLMYLEIRDYSYSNGTTKIYWADGTVTTCHADPDKADQYTGFMIAIAKRAMGNGNKATNEADWWINKLPARIKKAEEKEAAEQAEIERLEKKRRERRAKNRIRRAAIRRAEEYQAKLLAEKKYGVPTEFNSND